MDKFEYKIKADEIKELIAQQEYDQAAEIADSIDWRRVKSVMMLCTVSDLYKMCRRYEDSRDMLLLAYDRHPGGRTIVYSLCELSIKMEEFVQAVEYYKEYVEIAPKDTGRYILQYKLYEAQDVSLEERIAVLEELKKKDYREKWAYELAYLYHRVGLATKCVEECDELFLWFGDGKYVIKALELKMLHAPLTAEQQYKYDHRFGGVQPEGNVAAAEKVSSDTMVMQPIQKNDEGTEQKQTKEILNAETTRIPVEEIDIQVKTLDVGKYDTINLQEELAAGIQEYFGTSNNEVITRSIMEPMLSSDTSDIVSVSSKTDTAGGEEPLSEVFFGETGEIADMEQKELPTEEMKQETDIAQAVMMQMRTAEENTIQQVQPPSEMAGVLSMAGDGQISFVLPEREPIEKQITGQISINDIIIEWERLKKENEEKRKEEVRQHVLQQTGQMFTEFEASVRDGLLEKLESGEVQEENLEDTLAELFEDTKKEAENAVVAEELPAEEDVSAEVEPTAEEEAPAEAEPAIEEESSVEVELPVEEEAPAEVELPVEEEAPTEVELLVEEEAPAEVELPVEEEAPAEVELPVEEEAPTEVELLVEEEAPAEAESPVEEESPAELELPVEEKSPTEVELPVEEESSAEAVPPVEPEVQEEAVVREKRKLRNLTREEKELYGQYIQGRSMKEQLIRAIDGISMAAYTGNVIVTGDEGMDSVGLAKNIIREVQMSDSNFSGKIAKISGDTLNTRDVKQIIDGLNNGALIIQKASRMNEETAEQLYKVLQQENLGIVVVLEDSKRMMDRFLQANEQLNTCFTSRVDVAALSNDALVSFAKKYAREKEYSIDELGLLALHTRIADMQTSDHAVTVMEVKDIMDEAIENANRKSISHFFDIILGKRYDDEDMIILKEKDFI